MASASTDKLNRSNPLRVAGAAAACAALLLVVGCGPSVKSGPGTTSTGTSTGPATPAAKKAYEDAVEEALEPVISASGELTIAASTAATPKDLAPALATAASAYTNATTTLAQLEPPLEIKPLHVRLTKANRELAAATSAAQAAAEKDDKKGMASYKGAGEKYQAELTKLQGEFSAKGYEFGADVAGTGTSTTPTPTVPTTPTFPSPTPTTPTTTESTTPSETKIPTTPTSPPKGSPLPDAKDSVEPSPSKGKQP